MTLEDGSKHTARACGAALKKANNGTFYLVMQFKTANGDTASKNFFFSDKAFERTVEDLRVCGWEGDDPSEITTENLCGCDTNDVSIVIEHEPYTAQDGSEKVAVKVKWINAIGGGLKSNVESAEAQAFGASLKGRVAALRAKSEASGVKPLAPRKAPAQQSARPVPVPHTPGFVDNGNSGMDDEIPF